MYVIAIVGDMRTLAEAEVTGLCATKVPLGAELGLAGTKWDRWGTSGGGGGNGSWRSWWRLLK